MPVEVRELVIKAIITPEGTAGALSGATSSSNNNVSANEEIITACVEKILEILKEKHAR